MAFSPSSSSTAGSSTPPVGAPPVYPSLREEEEEEAAKPLVGYPAVTTVDGHPVYAYLPAALLPLRQRRRPCRRRCASNCSCLSLFLLAIAAVASFFTWPRALEMTVTDITLGKIHFNIKRGDFLIPQVYLNLTLDLRLQAQNPNYFGVTYETVTVSIFFEGDKIGEVESHGGDLGALSTSYVDATLELSGYQIASNVLTLLADVATGALPLQTNTVFDGHINALWFKLPLEGKVTCKLVIDPQNQVLLRQDCDV